VILTWIQVLSLIAKLGDAAGCRSTGIGNAVPDIRCDAIGLVQKIDCGFEESL